MKSYFVQKFSLAICSVLVMGFGLFIPATSLASAYGCAVGNPQYGPTTYCVELSGSSTYVNYVQGTWRGSAYVCNAYMTAEFFGTGWNWYQTLTSPIQHGCATGSGATINVYSYKWQGYMCSTLHYAYLNIPANRTMSVCHQIKL